MKNNIYDEINSPEVHKEYYEGKRNFIVRIYWYLDRGLDLLNQFKYLVGGIIALAVILKVEDSIEWMVTIFVIAVPLLILTGYLYVRYGARVLEYLNLKQATHFGQYNLKLQERQIELSEELLREIKKLTKKL